MPQRPRHSVVAVAMVLAAAVGLPSSPSRADSDGSVVIHTIDGPLGGTVRGRIMTELTERGYRVVPRYDVAQAAQTLGVSLESSGDWAAVAAELGVDAFVSGEVRRSRGFEARIWVRGADGNFRPEITVRAGTRRGLGRVLRRDLWSKLEPTMHDIEQTSAVAQASDEEEPPPMDMSTDDLEDVSRANLDPELFPEQAAERDSEESPIDDERPDEEPAERLTKNPLEAAVGLRVLNRGFDYRDNQSALRSYSMPLGPAAFVGLDWFPAAHYENGALADLGLSARFSNTFGISSESADGGNLDTEERLYRIGPRYRFDLGGSELHLFAAYGEHGFTVERATVRDGEAGIASVGYQHVQAGTLLRLGLSDDVALRIHGSYLLVLDAGEIAERHYFPDTTVHGIEAGLGLGYMLGSGFELRASVDGNLYLLEFHPSEQTESVEGAMDRYIAGSIGLVFHMGPDAQPMPTALAKGDSGPRSAQ